MLKKLIVFIIALLSMSSALADRIKDIASVSGVRSNQLVGYGLVVGLDGSGDNSQFTAQSFKTMLARLGVQLPPGINPSSKNIAAVALHAELPAFAKPGHKIDVTVSSIGTATSLRGGTLLLSPLKGADGEVYAVAQGNMVVGGFGAEGSDGSRIKVNVPVVGTIPNGATVEVSSPNNFAEGTSITFLLHRPDFTTAQRMTHAINSFMGKGTAKPIDGATIQVHSPLDLAQKVEFLSALENISLEPADASSKVVVNSRTGTIVIGKHVRIGPAAISHGSLTVTITETQSVSQPLPASAGTTAITPQSNIQVTQGNNRMFLFNSGTSLDEIVRAVNQVGAAPGDLMAILEALKKSGALRSELEII